MVTNVLTSVLFGMHINVHTRYLWHDMPYYIATQSGESSNQLLLVVLLAAMEDATNDYVDWKDPVAH